ncbi:C2 family cysteine protease [Microcoleus sp. T2B6]|uniref:C2 family cysteine protease n=1 Tax=Microcoleus sp. T2B6 TaxID=3055424 RepID=UPI002FD129BE
MASNNLFDLTSGVDIFTIDSKVPAGFGIRALPGADSIVGSDRPDLVYGNDGSDSISGGIGNDSLQGGRGADLLLGNAGDDYLQGERGNDVIYGGEDNDTLIGQEGDDFLAGGAGVDSLIGSDGSDAFVLNVADALTNPALADTIADFSDEEGDVIALTDGAGDALTEADVTLEANGTDTFIRLKATGGILARVQGVSPASLSGLFSTVKATLDDTEPGATVLGSIPGGANLQGSVGDEDYADFFQFQVTETSIVDLGLSAMSADADVALYKDKNDDGELGGDEILSASERSGTANETIENITLDPGKYFLSVEAFEDNTNYSLSLAGVAGTVAKDLAGDRPSTARLLPPDGEVELHDYVGGTDAVDTYRLEVLNGGYLDLSTDNRKPDLNLTLWSDRNSNDRLDADEIVAQGTNEIQEDNINPGTYYVNVSAPGAPTPYEIAAISEPGSRVDIENYDALFPGIPTTGTLTQNDDFDPEDQENYADPYLLTELAAGLTVTVTQESQDFDAYLTVVDLLTGEVVAKNDDINTSSGDFNAGVSFTTEQGGQYVVFASSVDAPGLGDYTLNATVTGTPVANALRSASAETLSPKPVFTNQSESPPKTYNFTYAPLTGGKVDPIRITDINQQQFGDCAFLASVAATFGKIDNLSAATTAKSSVLGSITPKGDNYTFKFYNYLTGTGKEVTVDNQVATNEGLVFGTVWPTEFAAKPSDATGQPIWAPIFERAYAKFREEEKGSDSNGYDVMGNGDQAGIALKRVTGKKVETIYWKEGKNFVLVDSQDEGGSYSSKALTDEPILTPEQKAEKEKADKNLTPQQKAEKEKAEEEKKNKENADEVFNRIQTMLDTKKGYVVAGAPLGAEQRSDNVLIGGHAYSVHNAYTDPKHGKMILVRNPWGKDNRGVAKAPEDPSSNTKDGFVAITFDRFLENFSALSLSEP